MQHEESFAWTSFYSELADKIAIYRRNRPELIGIVQKVHELAGMRVPKLDAREPVDIDPFTVFGLFNKGIEDESRTQIAAGFASVLHVHAKAPAEFAGIPVLNNLGCYVLSIRRGAWSERYREPLGGVRGRARVCRLRRRRGKGEVCGRVRCDCCVKGYQMEPDHGSVLDSPLLLHQSRRPQPLGDG